MPNYEYKCDICAGIETQRRAVDDRDEANWVCSNCGMRGLERIFTVTANIITPEHFRHMQSDFLPRAGDAAAWEHQGSSSAYHSMPATQPSFEEFVQRDLAQQEEFGSNSRGVSL
jgi:putative FmdB family regulatory protein